MSTNLPFSPLNNLVEYPQLVTGVYCFEDGESIIFQSSTAKVLFKAKPELFRRVIPLLDGRHTCHEIVEKAQSTHALELIRQLQEAKLIQNPRFDLSQMYHQASSWEYNVAPLINDEKATVELHRNTFLQQTEDETDMDSIALPDGTSLLENPFLEVLKVRTTTRNFKENAEFSQKQLDAILFAAAGHTHSRTADGVYPLNLRTFPSGGGPFPITLFVIVFAINGLEAGMYRYNGAHKLHPVHLGNFQQELGPHFVRPGIEHTNILILLTANFEQSQTKYGLRGYRFVFLEAGHLAQNIYLAAGALGIGACTIGGFSDGALNKFLGLDGIRKACIYAAVLGEIDSNSQT